MWGEKRRQESPWQVVTLAGKAAPQAALPPGLAPSKLLESCISTTHPEGLGQWLVRFGEQGGGSLEMSPQPRGLRGSGGPHSHGTRLQEAASLPFSHLCSDCRGRRATARLGWASREPPLERSRVNLKDP